MVRRAKGWGEIIFLSFTPVSPSKMALMITRVMGGGWGGGWRRCQSVNVHYRALAPSSYTSPAPPLRQKTVVYRYTTYVGASGTEGWGRPVAVECGIDIIYYYGKGLLPAMAEATGRAFIAAAVESRRAADRAGPKGRKRPPPPPLDAG